MSHARQKRSLPREPAPSIEPPPVSPKDAGASAAMRAQARIWAVTAKDIVQLAQKQLFFVGGAPRSGTTSLQCLLDSHPDVSCRGEGLFGKTLAKPLEAMAAARRQALEAKNANVFRHSSGYPLPADADGEFLLGAAILLALRQQSADKPCLAIGEKTPENVFFFPHIKRLFPAAKFIGVARDPRDVLASAWHFFHGREAGQNEVAAKTAFVRSALPALNEGARAMLALREQTPADCLIITYEAMRRDAAAIATRLFGFLGVSDQPDIVESCVARTSFAAMTGGRAAGVEDKASFFRKGVAGDWRSTLTPDMNAMTLDELGWMFPQFGWTP